jgi:hypothetical protein
MWISLKIGLPTLNGHSGWSPPNWHLDDPAIDYLAAARLGTDIEFEWRGLSVRRDVAAMVPFLASDQIGRVRYGPACI